MGFLLQGAADRIDAAYQPKPGQHYKGRASLQVDGIFGSFKLERDYYYHEGKKQGHYPADAALGLEMGCTPALARLSCLEGADESSYQKAENHLLETGGIRVGARQIQRLVQRVGAAAQAWQEREAQPGGSAVPIMYVSADGTGVPMRKEELAGRAGKQADGSAKTRLAYLGCVFTQHQTDEEGHPVRDYESTTYVSSFGSIEEFGPSLRQDAIRRGLALALQLVLLIDGAEGLANMGRLCFPGAIQIVDFYHALEHAGKVLVALLGSREHPDYKKRLGRWARRLLNDKVEQLIAQARQECAGKAQAQAVEKELGYFVNNVAAHAVWHLPPPRLLYWLRGHRSRLQDGDRLAVQAVGHVLGRTGRRERSGAALHSEQSPARRVLERRGLTPMPPATTAWRWRLSR